MTSSGDRIELLRSLWEGSPDDMAYQHVSIVFHLCTFAQQYQEPDERWVVNHLRTGYPRPDELDDEERQIIAEGLERWRTAGKPRVTLHPSEFSRELTSGR